MADSYAMVLDRSERLRANRRLRYASSSIRAIDPAQRNGEQHQDMQICNPCPPTFLLPISPAGQNTMGVLVDSLGIDGVSLDFTLDYQERLSCRKILEQQEKKVSLRHLRQRPSTEGGAR